MKMTLLDMVQSILNAMDSDPVNSIGDTVESSQVAVYVREAFMDLMTQRDWPHLRQMTTLENVSNVTTPARLKFPDNINKCFWIKYNKKDVEYLDPKQFHDILSNRVEQAGVVNSNGIVLNQDPVYWTTYDDKYVEFDGYDSTVDTTLVGSKSNVFVVKTPSWTHTDSFIPDIPDKWFPTLLAEAKAQSFINIKQQANSREERKAQRGRVVLRNETWRANDGEEKYNKTNYGRK